MIYSKKFLMALSFFALVLVGGREAQAQDGYFNNLYSGNLSVGGGNSISGGVGGSAVFGGGNGISASNSVAIGSNNSISGGYSLAFGTSNNVASAATNSGAIGNSNQVLAVGSFAIGIGLKAQSFQQIVVGSYNVSLPSPNATTWVATDPIFVIGNGISASAPSDALKVLKNGAVLINASGDLSMGTYTNGPTP